MFNSLAWLCRGLMQPRLASVCLCSRELLMLLPPHPRCWISGTTSVLGNADELEASRMLGKPSSSCSEVPISKLVILNSHITLHRPTHSLTSSLLLEILKKIPNFFLESHWNDHSSDWSCICSPFPPYAWLLTTRGDRSRGVENVTPWKEVLQIIWNPTSLDFTQVSCACVCGCDCGSVSSLPP